MGDFIKRLTSGPAFLFVGQGHLRLETGRDALLSQIIAKYGERNQQIESYYNIFDTAAGDNPEETIAWMQTRCRHLPLPTGLDGIGGYQWSGICTSAFDDVLVRAFRSEWREIQQISSTDYRPNDPRSRIRLNVWYLFGTLTTLEHAPLRREDLWRREEIAVLLASRLPELITPMGTLVIEGYLCDKDWFLPKKFFPIIDKLAKGQAHIFSVTDEIRSNQFLKNLIARDKLCPHEESLAEHLLSAAEGGEIKLKEGVEDIEFGHNIKIGGKSCNVPTALWNQIVGTSRLLPDSVYQPLPSLSDDQKYQEFRQFLYESSQCPPWRGYGRGFAYERVFEEHMRQEVLRRLENVRLRTKPVFLHGQTGTGKTVALGRLAYEIQKEGRWPVLFIERSTQPVRETIDRFCEWAEQKGASSTLVVWDGMQRPEQYYELLNYLMSRGRKVLLAGSCYRLKETDADKESIIEAPVVLSAEEFEGFVGWIKSMDEFLEGYIRRLFTEPPKSFLVFLYRLLPSSRPAIRRGVDQEVAHAEDSILTKTLNMGIANRVKGLLGEVLAEEGLIDRESTSERDSQEGEIEAIAELQDLIGLIMVPGRLNISCPFDLVLRSMKRGYSAQMVNILRTVDIFRWSEDRVGNLMVGPRTSLEAELIAKSRIGGAKFEIEYARRLIEYIRGGELFEKVEIQFVLNLVKSMGPNGSNPAYYKPFFPNIGESLEKIRTERGILEPRLMLQESMLYRESAKTEATEIDPQNLLEKSIKVAKEAMGLVDNTPRGKSLLSALKVELASAYGQKSVKAGEVKDRLVFSQMAQRECFEAFSLNPQNYHPIDVVSWTSINLLESGELADSERAEVEATALQAFDLADSEAYEDHNWSLLNERKESIYRLLGMSELSDLAFEEMLEQGSCSGIYVRASRIADFIHNEGEITKERLERYQKALKYLMGFEDRIANDGKCLYLLLRYWWAIKTGKHLFRGERNTLPLSSDDWFYCRKTIDRILCTEGFEYHLRLKYLFAVACFHLNDFVKGFESFKELDLASLSYGRRVNRLYLWSDANGRPRKFNGSVAWIDDNGKGEILVDEIRRRIRFLAHDSSRQEVKKRDGFDGFKIAFNLIGPIVDFREYRVYGTTTPTKEG